MSHASAARSGASLAVEGAPIEADPPVDFPVAAYCFRLTCTRCGGELRHTAYGRPQAGTWATAIARCVPCRTDYTVTATLRSTRDHNPRPVS